MLAVRETSAPYPNPRLLDRVREAICTPGMTAPRVALTCLLICALLAVPLALGAQQARIYRIGVILQGGPYFAAIEGLRDGLKELGLREGLGLTIPQTVVARADEVIG